MEGNRDLSYHMKKKNVNGNPRVRKANFIFYLYHFIFVYYFILNFFIFFVLFEIF